MLTPNDPVFPVHYPKEANLLPISGLNLRSYFAAVALHGMLAGNEFSELDSDKTAEEAVHYADVLIECLNKKREKAG